MSDITVKISLFVNDLRYTGVSVSPSELEDCFKSLQLIDWTNEQVFYSTLLCTLLKEYTFVDDFDQIYKKHFHFIFSDNDLQSIEAKHKKSLALGNSFGNKKSPNNRKVESHDKRENEKERITSKLLSKRKDYFELDFYTATYQSALHDINQMENLIPLLAKRMASKMVLKKRLNQLGTIDYRQTLRKNMNTGGILLDLYTKKKNRERPVIFALCDVSWSCLHFSYFSLSIVYLLEKFFREVRSFAFIGETDEITSIVKTASYDKLRGKVLSEANVSGASSYTNYGESLATFYDKYGSQLNHKTNVLIFGDARNNWYETNSKVLEEIKKRVRRVYWLNPDPKDEWGSGDSDILIYSRYCSDVFECYTLNQLTDAILKIR